MNLRPLAPMLLALACEGADARVDCPSATPETTSDAELERADDVSLDAVAWMQRSSEYQAVVVGTYAAARGMLDRALADPKWTAAPEQGPDGAAGAPAIVLDVDETVLDNSPYAAWMMREHRPFEVTTWNAWCAAGIASPIPGAVEFTQYAAGKGVAVFFVTNRDAAPGVEAGTLANLRAHGFPVDEQGTRLMLRKERPDWGTDKGTRRAEIAREHRIVMLVGDNLGDFVDGAKSSDATRRGLWTANAERWGRAWIMLPNPDYGSWEHPLYATPERLDLHEQRAKKLAALDVWPGPDQE